MTTKNNSQANIKEYGVCHGAYSFTATPEGDVCIRTLKGWSLHIPRYDMMAAHLLDFIQKEDVKSLTVFANMYYAITTLVPDAELYKDIIASIDSYVKRNTISEHDETASQEIIEEESEMYNIISEMEELENKSNESKNE